MYSSRLTEVVFFAVQFKNFIVELVIVRLISLYILSHCRATLEKTLYSIAMNYEVNPRQAAIGTVNDHCYSWSCNLEIYTVYCAVL